LTAACCELHHQQPPRAINIPDAIRSKLAEFCSAG
jgi:hypothetical protein